jgi:hypothetical protein
LLGIRRHHIDGASLLRHSNGVEQAILAGRPRSKAGRNIFVFDGTAKMGT